MPIDLALVEHLDEVRQGKLSVVIADSDQQVGHELAATAQMVGTLPIADQSESELAAERNQFPEAP